MKGLKVITTFLIAASTLTLSGCKTEEPLPPSASGEQLFERHCAGCHRPAGTGNFLKGIPANAMTYLDTDQVVDLILRGDPERPKMPSFPQLNRFQAERIADHLWDLREALIKRHSES